MRKLSTFCRKWFSGLFFILALPVFAQELPSSVKYELELAGIPENSVGIMVEQVDSNVPRLTHNADIAFAPASTMKVLTTYAALELLGPSYTWETGAYISGKPEDGVLYGDLIIKGSGDPVFSQKELWLFIRQIQDAGVRDIRGNVILDRSVFKTGPFDAAAFDAEPLKPYNAGPDALLLNEKKIDIRLVPNESENTVKVVFEPRLDGVKITPPLLSNGECGNWKKDIVLQFDDRHANFEGMYSSTCQEKIWSVLPYQMSNTRYFESVFSTLWKEAGGRFKGRFVDGTLPPEALKIAEWRSPELSSVVSTVNKHSNNVMARQLLLGIGHHEFGDNADESMGIAAIKNWLASKNISSGDLVIENGSGLSRLEKMSPLTMSQILKAAFHSPVMPELMSSFPIAGKDGTMSKRLKEDEIAGKAHIKTGAIDNVRAIAGYVLAKSGRRYIVVCMVNDPNAKFSRNMLNELLNWTYENN